MIIQKGGLFRILLTKKSILPEIEGKFHDLSFEC